MIDLSSFEIGRVDFVEPELSEVKRILLVLQALSLKHIPLLVHQNEVIVPSTDFLDFILAEVHLLQREILAQATVIGIAFLVQHHQDVITQGEIHHFAVVVDLLQRLSWVKLIIVHIILQCSEQAQIARFIRPPGKQLSVLQKHHNGFIYYLDLLHSGVLLLQQFGEGSHNMVLILLEVFPTKQELRPTEVLGFPHGDVLGGVSVVDYDQEKVVSTGHFGGPGDFVLEGSILPNGVDSSLVVQKNAVRDVDVTINDLGVEENFGGVAFVELEDEVVAVGNDPSFFGQ